MEIKGTTCKNEENAYDDIILLPHPDSKKHVRMKPEARAAQFAPFAALTGYESAVEETARLTENQTELDESEKECLDVKLQQLQSAIVQHPCVTIVYFEKDERKEGGAYLTVSGVVKKIDSIQKEIVMEDGRRVPIGRIRMLEAEPLA